MADIADRLGAFASGLSLEAIPDPVQRAALRCVVDVVGVTLAGSTTDFAERVRRHVALAYGGRDCRIIGTAATGSALGAALANGAAAHVLDFDDTCYSGIVHGSAAVFPAVLAATGSAGTSGDELLTAFIAGCEVEYAIGRALGDGVYRWWTTALLGAIGAAAGAARALRLDAGATADAIRIAACASGGLRAVFGSAAKPYLCGRAAQSGLEAALAAGAGIAGPDGALEAPNGFFAGFGEGGPDTAAFASLGRRYALLDPGIAVKLFPVCSAAQAAVEAASGLLAEHAVAGELVEHVRCETTPFVTSCLVHAQPQTVAQAQFSMNFAVGCILDYGVLDLSCLDGARLDDPRLRQAMAKVEMVEAEPLAQAARDNGQQLEAASVTIVLRDGRILTRHVPEASGMPGNPASDDRLDAKFRACAAPVLSAERAETLLRRLRSLATLPSVAALFD